MLAVSAGTLAGSARTQRGLVVVQVALSCSLLILGGLLEKRAEGRGRRHRLQTGSGVIGTVQLDDQGYSAAAGTAFYDKLQSALTANAGPKRQPSDGTCRWRLSA